MSFERGGVVLKGDKMRPYALVFWYDQWLAMPISYRAIGVYSTAIDSGRKEWAHCNMATSVKPYEDDIWCANNFCSFEPTDLAAMFTSFKWAISGVNDGHVPSAGIEHIRAVDDPRIAQEDDLNKSLREDWEC